MKFISKIVVFVLCLISLAMVGCGTTSIKGSEQEISAISPAGIYPTLFHADEETFNKLFVGKYIEFSGCVFKIEEDEKNICLIFYSDNSEKEALVAFLDSKNDPNLKNLRRNSFVVMRGFVNEGTYRRDTDQYGVIVERCVIKDVLVKEGFNGRIQDFPKVNEYMQTHLINPSPELNKKNAFLMFMNYGSGTGNKKTDTRNNSNSKISYSQNAATGNNGGNKQTSPIHMGAIRGAYESSADKEGSYVHSAKLTIDGNTATCWTEGVQGLGIGESITYTFNNTYKISGFDIWIGHQKSSDLFYKNARPTKIRVEGTNGQSTIVDLNDTFGSQRVTLSTPMSTNSLTLTIEAANPGSKWQDTSIAEIRFF